MAKGDTLLQLS
ncbi:unnamed protein product [Linum tenue]|uniref:Uncharacterized protein n=1 Tax=Linum tenue TaxID=586396 RepID=A0AAV0NS15_9ROSI|nr:unnamed protein product [Linum tenue]CAI0461440.1 unnamed protein product [Linum tenue]